MMKKKIMRKSLISLLMLLMLFASVQLAFAHTALNSEAELNFGTPDGSSVVTGLVESADKYFVTNTVATGVYLRAFDKANIEGGIAAEYFFDDSAVVDITHNGAAEGYIFAEKTVATKAGSNMENAAIAVDASGNFYLAVVESSESALLYGGDVWNVCFAKTYADCICGSDYCYPATYNSSCPVCSAFMEFSEEFTPTIARELKLYKFSPVLQKLGEFSVSAAPTEGNVDLTALTVDADGNIYLGGGSTKDLNFTAPVYGFSAFDNNITAPGTPIDTNSINKGFIVKIPAAMDKVEKATWFGGWAKYNAYLGPESIVLDLEVENGVLYAVGEDAGGKIGEATGVSSSWLNKSSVLSSDGDAYIAKFKTDDMTLQAYTYFGGASSDILRTLVLTEDAVYAAGVTTSTGLPTSANAYQRSLKTGSAASPYNDIFVLRIAKELINDADYAATYIGGVGRDDLYALEIASDGSVYFAGETFGSSSYPTTDGTGSAGTIIFSKLNSDLSNLEASTILGSIDDAREQGRGLAATTDGIVLAGHMNVGGSIAPQYQTFLNLYSNKLAHACILEVEGYPDYFSNTPVRLGLNSEIQMKVIFDSYVKVDTASGTPTLKLNIKKADNSYAEAVYLSGSGTQELLFSYTVAAGDTTGGVVLDSYDANALLLNGGSILPQYGTDASEISLKVPTGGYNLNYANIYVNTIPQTISSVTTTVDAATYGVGAIIPLTVSFSQGISEVDITAGTPYIELNSGGKAHYVGKGEEANQLIFEYTVAENESTTALNYADINAFKANGAVIKDDYGIAPALDLPALDSAGSLTGQKTVVIDSSMAKIISVTADKSNVILKAGDKVDITVTFDRPITTSGVARLSLNLKTIRNLEAAPVTAADTLVFTYEVKAGDEVSTVQSDDGYLNYTSSALVFTEGGITDENGNPGSAYLPAADSAESISLNKIKIDTLLPAVSYVSKYKNGESYSSSYYKAGDRLGARVSFNEDVNISLLLDAATLTLNFASAAEGEQSFVLTSKGYAETDIKNILYFEYVLKDTDQLTKGAIQSWELGNSASITDAAGNPADTLMPAPAAYLWELYFDSAAPVFAAEAALSASYDQSNNNITISWPKIENDSSGIAAYNLYRQTDDEESMKFIGTKTGFYAEYLDESVLSGTKYTYTLYAEDYAGNVSEPLISVPLTTPGEKPTTDTLSPYWSTAAELKATRTKTTEALLEWDVLQALDDDGTIAGYKVYMFDGNSWGDTPIAEIDDASVTSCKVENITNDISTTYAFRVTVIDAAGHESLQTDAITADVEYEAPALTVRDSRTQQLQYQYVQYEIDQLTHNDARYSSLNNEGYEYWYSATGVYLEDIMTDLGITEYSSVSVEASDLSINRQFTRAQVEGEGLYYFSPDPLTAPVASKPMLAYIAASWGSGEPPFFHNYEDLVNLQPGMEIVDGIPRLLYGQTSTADINKPYFAKTVATIYVDFSNDPLYYQLPVISGVSTEDYYVLKGTAIPADILPAPAALTALDAYGVSLPADAFAVSYELRGLPVDSIDTNQIGTYKVTYTATDARGNVAKKEKQIIVYEQDRPGAYQVNIDPSVGALFAASTEGDVPVMTVASSVTAEREISFSFRVTSQKLYNDAQSVLAVHMRGNKMLGLSMLSNRKDVTAFIYNGSFNAKGGDKIYIYIVDELTSDKTQGTVNLLF